MAGQSVVIKGSVDPNLPGGTRKTAVVDANGHLATVDAGLALVEEGKLYVANKWGERVRIDEWIEFLFRTPAGKAVAVRARHASEGASHREIFTGPDIALTGAAYPVTNRNLIVGDTPDTLVYDLPTLGGGGEGTLLYKWVQGNRNGGQEVGTGLWVMEPDTDYLIRATNVSGSRRDMSLTVDFFEGALE